MQRIEELQYVVDLESVGPLCLHELFPFFDVST